jgi:glycine C-acetyltransferase
VFWNARKQKEIVAMKQFNFLVDDAHVWYTRKTGAGAGEEQGVQDDIDVYFQLCKING